MMLLLKANETRHSIHKKFYLQQYNHTLLIINSRGVIGHEVAVGTAEKPNLKKSTKADRPANITHPHYISFLSANKYVHYQRKRRRPFPYGGLEKYVSAARALVSSAVFVSPRP